MQKFLGQAAFGLFGLGIFLYVLNFFIIIKITPGPKKDPVDSESDYEYESSKNSIELHDQTMSTTPNVEHKPTKELDPEEDSLSANVGKKEKKLPYNLRNFNFKHCPPVLDYRDREIEDDSVSEVPRHGHTTRTVLQPEQEEAAPTPSRFIYEDALFRMDPEHYIEEEHANFDFLSRKINKGLVRKKNKDEVYVYDDYED